MSFRQFGGKTYSAKNNIISNHYSATNNLTITDNIGQSNSHINSLSDLDVCGNITASGNITANYMFLSSEYISTEDNAVMPKSYIDNIVTGKLNAGEGLNITTDVSGKSYINVDNSLNNIEYLDNNAGVLHLGEHTDGNIIIGKDNTNQTTTIQNQAIVKGGLDVSGTLSYQNYPQPIILSCQIKRNPPTSGETEGYYIDPTTNNGFNLNYSGPDPSGSPLYDGSGVGFSSMGNIIINFESTLKNSMYNVQLTGLRDGNDNNDSVIYCGYKNKSTNGFRILFNNKNGLTNLSTQDTHDVIDVVVFYYPYKLG